MAQTGEMAEGNSTMKATTTTIALATVVASAVPATAQATEFRPDCAERLIHSANHHRHIVVARHGNRAAGRDIIRFGRIGPNQHPHKVRDCKIIRRYRDQLIQLHTEPRYPTLKRVAVPPPRPPAGVQTPSVDGIYGGGGYAIPEDIVMCESGGNYGAVNPSSGAYGAYQILPSTSAAYGCDMSTPAGQDECAAKVWAGQGRGAWVC